MFLVTKRMNTLFNNNRLIWSNFYQRDSFKGYMDLLTNDFRPIF